MAEFTLKRKPVKTLKVNIGDESFHIPLSMCLTPEELAPLGTAEGTRDFFRKYLSEDVKKILTIEDYNEITRAWIDASNKAGGKTTGE
jgi:hypothetical protein